MDKTIYSRQSECVRNMLVALRNQAGLTQRQLADKLGRERSLIGRLEFVERRLDLVDLFWLCKACGADAHRQASQSMRQLDKLQTELIPPAACHGANPVTEFRRIVKS